MKKTLAFTAATLAALLCFTACNQDDSYIDKIGPGYVRNFSFVKEDGDNNYFVVKWSDPKDKDVDHILIRDNKGGVEAKIKTGVGEAEIEIDLDEYDIYSLENSENQYTISAVDIHGNEGPRLKFVDSYVLGYFKSAGSYSSTSADSNAITQNALYLATSGDGLNYKAANNGSPVLVVPENVGYGGRAIRDPYVYRRDDGIFVMIATDWTPYCNQKTPDDGYNSKRTLGYWGVSSPCIIVSYSKDLINWTDTRQIKICSDLLTVWAPEVFRDDGSSEKVTGTKYKYGMIWSGNATVATDGVSDVGNRDRKTFVNYTNDFITFSEPYLFFTDDYTGSVVTEIDASIIKGLDGRYYMFFKNEAGDAKDIAVAVSDNLLPHHFVDPDGDGEEHIWEVLHDGQYISRDKDQNTGNGIEGSWELYINGNWWMFGDAYGSTSLEKATNFWGWSCNKIDAPPAKWKRHANDGTYTMPIGTRHGSAFRVTTAELKALKNATAFPQGL